jgi:hypothetical protein
MNPTISAAAVIEALKSQHARGDLAAMRATCRGVPDEGLLALVNGDATLTDEGETWSFEWELGPAPVDSDLAIALDHEVTARQVAETHVAELLEHIALVTGVDLSTAPTAEAVAAGLAVLDSLTTPTEAPDGWTWTLVGNRPTAGLVVPCRADAEEDANSRHLPFGFFVLRIRGGRALAPMHVPTRGSN